MLDSQLRARLVAPVLDSLARRLATHGVPAGAVTAAAFAAGAAACVAAGLGSWWVALALWIANRTLDGLDGLVARRVGPTDLGGYFDLACDLVVYAGFVVAVAVAVPGARLARVALLAAYYVNAGAWLSYSALAERRRLGGGGGGGGDNRSLRFVPGLAEGAETFLAYALLCLLPEHAATIAWAFAALVALSATQRVVLAVRTL